MSTEKNTKAKPNTVTVTVKNAASTEQTAELDVRKQKDISENERGENKKEIQNLETVSTVAAVKTEEQNLHADKIIEIPFNQITENPDNPFQVRRDDEMLNMIESIEQYGVLTPLLVRPLKDGSYQLVSGHRRKFAAGTLNVEKLPCIVKEFTDDEAAIFMVDSNLQREHILPSERAKAYKLKYDAIKRQSGRHSKNEVQIGPHLKSAEIIAKNDNTSANSVKKFIRLNELIPEILDMVDKKEIALNAAYEISFIPQDLQNDLLEVIGEEDTAPSLKQALRLKKAAQEGKLNRNGISLVLQEEKPLETKIVIKGAEYEKYFPKDSTPKQREEIIKKALEIYWKKLERAKKNREETR